MKQAYKVEDLVSSREAGGSLVFVGPGESEISDAPRNEVRSAVLDEDSAFRWVGFIDRIGPDAIHGWAYDTKHPEGSVTVEAVTETGKRSVSLANLFREDVANAGHGTGKYGFVLDLVRLGLKDETVIVRFADSKRLISHEPIDFNAQRALLCQMMPPSFADAMLLLASRIRTAAETDDAADIVR